MRMPSKVVVAVLERPDFDNAHLGDLREWVHHNIGRLARFYKQCGHAIGASDDTDLDIWLRCQHDIELHRMHREVFV